MRILGVDPGSRITGYGCVEWVGNQIRHITHGTLRVHADEAQSHSMEQRLLSIFQGVNQVIQEFKPQVLVVERVFFAKNAVSALKLGQARGVILVSGALQSLPVFEYSATQVKAALTGHGQAEKSQVARMVSMVIGRSDFKTWDASDGLALAICHAFYVTSKRGVSVPRKKNLSLAESVGFSSPVQDKKGKGGKIR